MRAIKNITIGAILGAISVVPLLLDTKLTQSMVGVEYNKNFFYQKEQGSHNANIWLKFYTAYHGLVASDETQGIYFISTEDINGNAYEKGKCYEIRGTNLDSKFWSLTAYALDNKVLGDKDSTSINDKTLMLKDNKYDAMIVPFEEKKDHLGDKIIVGENDFKLVLRLYGPSKNVATHPEDVKVPIIKEVECTQ